MALMPWSIRSCRDELVAYLAIAGHVSTQGWLPDKLSIAMLIDTDDIARYTLLSTSWQPGLDL